MPSGKPVLIRSPFRSTFLTAYHRHQKSWLRSKYWMRTHLFVNVLAVTRYYFFFSDQWESSRLFSIQAVARQILGILIIISLPYHQNTWAYHYDLTQTLIPGCGWLLGRWERAYRYPTFWGFNLRNFYVDKKLKEFGDLNFGTLAENIIRTSHYFLTTEIS
jgi:hypothetical protein